MQKNLEQSSLKSLKFITRDSKSISTVIKQCFYRHLIKAMSFCCILQQQQIMKKKLNAYNATYTPNDAIIIMQQLVDSQYAEYIWYIKEATSKIPKKAMVLEKIRDLPQVKTKAKKHTTKTPPAALAKGNIKRYQLSKQVLFSQVLPSVDFIQLKGQSLQHWLSSIDKPESQSKHRELSSESHFRQPVTHPVHLDWVILLYCGVVPCGHCETHYLPNRS